MEDQTLKPQETPPAEIPFEVKQSQVLCRLKPGALVDLNGGHFKIKSVGLKMVVLEALAGTAITRVN